MFQSKTKGHVDHVRLFLVDSTSFSYTSETSSKVGHLLVLPVSNIGTNGFSTKPTHYPNKSWSTVTITAPDVVEVGLTELSNTFVIRD